MGAKAGDRRSLGTGTSGSSLCGVKNRLVVGHVDGAFIGGPC
jgi:hypothetical protein